MTWNAPPSTPWQGQGQGFNGCPGGQPSVPPAGRGGPPHGGKGAGPRAAGPSGRTGDCFQWMDGNCTRGASCTYKHDPAKLGIRSAAEGGRPRTGGPSSGGVPAAAPAPQGDKGGSPGGGKGSGNPDGRGTPAHQVAFSLAQGFDRGAGFGEHNVYPMFEVRAGLGPEGLGEPSLEESPLEPERQSLFSLSEMVRVATETSGGLVVDRLSSLPPSQYETRARGRPSGYNAITRLLVGKRTVRFVVDTGATCSAIPEELACWLIAGVTEDVKKGVYSPQDPVYPICKIERYTDVDEIRGIAKDQPLKCDFSMTLRCEFAPVGCDRGPMRDITFKVFPRGQCDFDGGILGLPVLDCKPFGLGHQLTPTGHFFRELQVTLPRLEAPSRTRMRAALNDYLGVASQGGETGKGS